MCKGIESYEIFQKHGINEEIFKSSTYDLVRRDTRDKESKDTPGIDNEPRPPPANTRTPTVTLSTQFPSKQTVERTVTTRKPEVTTMSTSTPTLNHSVNVSELRMN